MIVIGVDNPPHGAEWRADIAGVCIFTTLARDHRALGILRLAVQSQDRDSMILPCGDVGDLSLLAH